jgi:hypothetical protein
VGASQPAAVKRERGAQRDLIPCVSLCALLCVCCAVLCCVLLQGKPKSASVAERVLAVSWLVLAIGLLVSSAVCGFVLWRSPTADTAYRQAVVAHGEC